ncbi:hypothetical protein ACIBEK_24785 [Nocardia fusca]|uniref:Uncharacterized protein n=1 Tax=Nocardia fusca TaxID=941183 RepID=A0ABV3F4C4_9NOCA
MERLLVVGYVRPHNHRPEGVVFVFDSGVIAERDVAGMTFREGEILSAGFYTLQEAAERVKPSLADRLASALAAAQEGATVLCEQGRRLF